MAHWTTQEKLDCWRIFLDTDPSQLIMGYSQMASHTCRSIDSCSSMIWKLYHRGREKIPYWHRGDNVCVVNGVDRKGHEWRPQEDCILRDSLDEMVPSWRLAELLGRHESEVDARLLKIKSAGRPTLMQALKNDNAT